jgi:hypothetical protein|tara:strand:- start:304 stop:750 length:447 start_codon:yes stop_codon:yes gene_type:complete
MVSRTKRKKVVDALVNKIKLINGQYPYNSNVSDNVDGHLKFLDEIEQYPKVCVIAGDEFREYQPNAFKWRLLDLTIRVYIHDNNDTQETLALLLDDIESIIDDNDNLVYDDTVDPSQSTTSLTIGSISTDEGVIAPLGIGEMTVRVRY